MEKIEKLINDINSAKQKIKNIASDEIKRLIKKHGNRGSQNSELFYITLLDKKRLDHELDVNEIVYKPKTDSIEVTCDMYDDIESDTYLGQQTISFEKLDYINQVGVLDILRKEFGE